MKTQFFSQETVYDGTQLRSHWIFDTLGILGDAVVAFRGACRVPCENMVDLEDVRDHKPIASESMLHFIGEFFGADLKETILRQRLLISLTQQEIIFRTQRPAIVRGGNDLYDEGAKLSVAIATASPVSTVFHFGVNISSKGTPVKTKGLENYKIDPESFAKSLLETFRNEMDSVREAMAKVRAVP